MSIAVMTEVWKNAPVAGTELLMLLALADSANDDRECWPSLAHLQHKVRLSLPQTRKVLSKLADAGLIEKVINGGKGKKGRQSNLYKIMPLTGIAHDTPEVSQVIPLEGERGIAHDTLNRHLEPSSIQTPDGAKASEPKPAKEKKPRPPNKNEPLHDALLECFGLTPDTVTKTGDRTYWIAAADLGKINFPAERVQDFYNWCDSQGWKDFTVMAMAKHAGEWLAGNKDDDDPYAEMFSHLTIIK